MIQPLGKAYGEDVRGNQNESADTHRQTLGKLRRRSAAVLGAGRPLRDDDGQPMTDSKGNIRYEKRNAVYTCGWARRKSGDAVSIHEGDNGFYYKNIQSCDSPWVCPVCSHKIASHRAAVMRSHLLPQVKRGDVYVMLVTLTVAHTDTTPLSELHDVLSSALTRIRRLSSWVTWRDKIRYLADLRSTEHTHSIDNGWHPHYHMLMVLESRPDDATIERFTEWLSDTWADKVAKSGGRASRYHAVKVSHGVDKLVDYVAKVDTWDIASEMARGDLKKPRHGKGLTPFGILANTSDNVYYTRLWREYSDATHRKQTMTPSKGFFDVLGINWWDDVDTSSDASQNASQNDVVNLLDAYFVSGAYKVLFADRGVLSTSLIDHLASIDDGLLTSDDVWEWCEDNGMPSNALRKSQVLTDLIHAGIAPDIAYNHVESRIAPRADAGVIAALQRVQRSRVVRDVSQSSSSELRASTPVACEGQWRNYTPIATPASPFAADKARIDALHHRVMGSKLYTEG